MAASATTSATPHPAQSTIAHTDEKRFDQDQVERLFRSVGWESAGYPQRLHRALIGSDTVFSAWDGGRLVELVRDRYRDYFFLEVMPEERANAPFYERHGFRLMEDGAAMQIVNRG
ncbi:GNAT family N-acetyltransferase [Bifidobacterium pullorum subsp. saeculare]|uniref:GNAT family N-acetyltransferase n=1 Tax=Bifidobacterium pullorum subsp. saeculare TaxID=78257 RepID=A0A938WXT3_9BIFI|nr:GNAT family N-acetyltransferase [Bifidobacterium pullorum]MBM6699239.1 GNAT family N-acetyltransferase [Bifidobacterium pullorum subsp. saeculare]